MLNMGLILGKMAWVLQGRDVLEDIAEEIPFVSFSSGALHFPAFVPVGLIKQKQRMLNNPHASSGLGPRSSQILHVFKDLKHAIIGYIVLCPTGLRVFFFNVSKHSFMVVLLRKIQYYLKLLAKLNVFYIPESF